MAAESFAHLPTSASPSAHPSAHPSARPLHVTAPALAPLHEFTALLEGVWERGILTHNGPLVQQFERDLCTALQLPGFVAVSNGTIALQTAIKALDLQGEIITTPFTWIASISAIQWQGCTPVFCDIDPETLNLDPARLEPLITERTSAIMPVHVFGNPCDIETIQTIAERHGLKVIYDAAHALGSRYAGRSLLSYGDIAATSLHATKLLNTAEGGGCISTDVQLQARMQRLRFFGHDADKQIVEPGFNGKMTEVHAALGLANLKYLETVLAERQRQYDRYSETLAAVPGLQLQRLIGEPNRSYFPVIFESEAQLLQAVAAMESQQIFARRYFYPAVNTFSALYTEQTMPIAEDIANRILCLPLYWGLADQDQDRVIDTLVSTLRG